MSRLSAESDHWTEQRWPGPAAQAPHSAPGSPFAAGGDQPLRNPFLTRFGWECGAIVARFIELRHLYGATPRMLRHLGQGALDAMPDAPSNRRERKGRGVDRGTVDLHGGLR